MKGYKDRMNEIVGRKMMPIFRELAIGLLMDAMQSKEHGDLTGNTMTSFTVGIYRDGRLYDVINLIDVANLDYPKYKKLVRDNVVYTVERYDGRGVSVVDGSKLIDTDGKFGFEFARSFLESYKPPFSKGWGLVLTTGTEYSEYLEDVRSLNVLTETMMFAGNVFNNIVR